MVLTPTYSGCPATEVIEHDVLAAIDAAGLGPARVRLQRAPAWTTDWISAEGRREAARLRHRAARRGRAPTAPQPIRVFGRERRAACACPRCGSATTERLSAFGSTACKAMYRCLACREPFEYFKPI